MDHGDWARQHTAMRHRPTRRNWLAGAAAVAGAAMMSGSRSNAEEPDDQGYIDAHSHVWTPDTTAYPLDDRFDVSAMQPPSFTAEQLLEHAAPSGVRRVVLIQMSFYGFDNSYMLDVIQKHPGKFSGVAVIDPASRPVETMKSLRTQGVRGFRIVSGKQPSESWLDSDGMKKMWATAADQSMAICPLINPEYLASVDKMCQRYPETTVVIDHFARIGIDGTIHKRDLDSLCRLARHKNTYVKTSAFYALGKKTAPYTDLGEMIRRLAGEFGSARLMWATDCPYQVVGGHTYRDSIELIRSKLDFLTDTDRDSILRKTAGKVFFS